MPRLHPIRLMLVLSLAAAAGGCASRGLSPAPTPAPTPGAGAVVIPVTLGEFTIEPRRYKLKAGKVTFEVTNRGAVDHDFHISGLEAPHGHERHMLKPGEHAALRYDLKPGKYDIVCTVPGHQEAGMTATLEVVP